MSQPVTESFGPIPFAADADGLIIGSQGGALGGFLCTASGTVTLSYGQSGGGAAIVNQVPVSAGVFLPMPFEIPPGVFLFATLAGGAAGTFAVI